MNVIDILPGVIYFQIISFRAGFMEILPLICISKGGVHFAESGRINRIGRNETEYQVFLLEAPKEKNKAVASADFL